MQKCPKCGEDIRYIATGYERYEVCGAERVEIITEGGHRAKGYLLHDCKETRDDEQEESTNNKQE